MEQTAKMFIGCPYEGMEMGCQNCPNYQKCLAKKRARINQRKAEEQKRALIKTLSVFVFIFCLMTGINQIYLKISASSTEKTLPEEITVMYIEEETEKKSDEYVAQLTEVSGVQKAEISSSGPSDEYYYSISEEDKVLIAKVVYAEARGECFEGKVAVASVILNRYFNGEGQAFDRSSIEAVVTQPYQFASIANVTMENIKNNPECMEAVEAACKGWDPTREAFEEGAFFFYAPKGVTGKQAEIREGIKVLVIGNHNFHADFVKIG